MEDKILKGTNYKTKGEHGNSGPENFVHPTFKISGSAPENSLLGTFGGSIHFQFCSRA